MWAMAAGDVTYLMQSCIIDHIGFSDVLIFKSYQGGWAHGCMQLQLEVAGVGASKKVILISQAD